MAKGKKLASKKKVVTEPSAEEEVTIEKPVEEVTEEIPEKKPTKPSAKAPKKPAKAPGPKKAAKAAKTPAPKKAVKRVKAEIPAKVPTPEVPTEIPTPEAPEEAAEIPEKREVIEKVKEEISEVLEEKPVEKPAAPAPKKLAAPAPKKPAAPAPKKPAAPAPKKPAAPAPKKPAAPAPKKPAAPAPKKPAAPAEIEEEKIVVEEEMEEITVEEFKFEDKFDKDRAYEHVKSLAFPRMVGTDGEQKAVDYIKDKFSEMNLTPVEEEFTFTNYATDIWTRAIQGLEGALLIIALCLFTIGIPGLITAVCISIALIILTIYSSIWARFFYKFQNTEGKLIKAKNFKSKNIIAKIDCVAGKENASGEIVIFSHYDSKSQLYAELWNILFFYLSLILNIALPFLYIGYAILFSSATLNPLSYLIGSLILTIIAIVATAFLLINYNRDNSPGAINNASGLGVFLELAAIHTQTPLENLNLTFVATGAEEMGLQGAISFLKLHEKELNAEETYFINIKEAGVCGHLYMPGPVGFPPQMPCLEVERIVKKILRRRQIPLKEGSKSVIRVISPWVLSGAGEDIIPILRGFNANQISIGGYSTVPFLIEGLRKSTLIHTKKDTIEQIDVSALDVMGKVMAEVLKRIDLRART